MLDCPPVINEVSEQIIHAADVLLVPVLASPLAMRTLDSVRHELARNHARHPPILPVLSMYNASRPLHREVRKGVADGWPVVPMATQIEQSAVRQAPLGSFASGSRADAALDRLWRGIEAKLAERAFTPPQPSVIAA